MRIITIDGQAGVGKGTLARRLATHFGLPLLDSGALYRLVAYLGADLDNANNKAFADIAQNLCVQFLSDGTLVYDGKKVGDEIRTEAIGLGASNVAKMPEVRSALVDLQRTVSKNGLVADGRDMGTVIFPQAQTKFFLIASDDVRAQRRYQELIERGECVDFLSVKQAIVRRDLADSGRTIAPLIPAQDALIIDTSDMTADMVFMQALVYIDDSA